MRITDVQAYVLALPEITTACDGTQDTCLIRVDTDAGITGWGEVDSCPSVVKAVVDAPLSHQICTGLRHALLGADPLAIEVCMQRMDQATNYYGRSGAVLFPRQAIRTLVRIFVCANSQRWAGEIPLILRISSPISTPAK